MAKKKTTKKLVKKKSPTKMPPIKNDPRVFDVHPQVYYRHSGPGVLTLIRLQDPEQLFEIEGIAMELFVAIDGHRTVSKVLEVLYGHARPQGFAEQAKAFLLQLAKMNLIVRTN